MMVMIEVMVVVVLRMFGSSDIFHSGDKKKKNGEHMSIQSDIIRVVMIIRIAFV